MEVKEYEVFHKSRRRLTLYDSLATMRKYYLVAAENPDQALTLCYKKVKQNYQGGIGIIREMDIGQDWLDFLEEKRKLNPPLNQESEISKIDKKVKKFFKGGSC